MRLVELRLIPARCVLAVGFCWIKLGYVRFCSGSSVVFCSVPLRWVKFRSGSYVPFCSVQLC